MHSSAAQQSRGAHRGRTERSLRASVGATPPPRSPSWSGTWPRAREHVGGLPQPWRTPGVRRRGRRARARRPGRGRERLAACGRPAGAVLRRLVAGEIGAGHAGRARPRPDRRSSAPRGDAVLHLVTNALPETVAGYTVRTQGIARAQRARGLDVARRHPDRVPGHQGTPRRGRPGDRRRGPAPPGCCPPGCRSGPTPPWPADIELHRPAGRVGCARPCCTRTATT